MFAGVEPHELCKLPEVVLPEVRLTEVQHSMQWSNTQMSGPKVSSSQGSLLSDSQAYRIPRVQSTLGEDDLTRKTAFLMGSFAKLVMEGGAAMLREYLDATNKGSNSG